MIKSRRRSPFFLAGILLVAWTWTMAASEGQSGKPAFDPSLFQALEYRSIGPYRGGRVTAVTGVRGLRDTFYMGSTGGGVWKTTDGGETWKNVSDEFFGSASVGAIAVAASDPNVVYAGMGSACIRGNVSPGNGVYRSTDAGETWSHVGLEDAGQIGRIRVHPQNPDLVYVAVLGHAFGPNAERGVFRSKDGGESWEKVLYINDRTGAVDLSMDPANPRILFAGLWVVERKPWTLMSGGQDGGLYKSADGGDTWEEMVEGLPDGMTGRIGVAISPAEPGRVWAIVEAEEGGIFRSENGGKKFRRINQDRSFRQRAWYYTHIYADPQDADTVYVLNVGLYRSTDGGKTFGFIRAPHGDHHDLWINPDQPDIMINSNDGGANVTYNGGRSWSTQANQPTAEFYRLTVGQEFPYRVYGAQQDNSTVSIPSRTSSSGITRRHWYPVGGGESGHVAVDPRDPNIVYAGSYGGTITRYDHRTGQARNLLAYPQLALGQAPRDLRYRFQWNAPIRLSPHDPGILYHASNVVHRSIDQGHSWEVISPDLTRNDRERQDYSGGPLTWDNTGVEVYGTIFALEESPHQKGLLWAGSDDGRVHVSRDGGGRWEEITPKEMPEWGQVNMIDLSTHDPGRALIAVTRYKMDDFRPYIFRTDNYGKSWRLLTSGKNGIPANHFVRVVREDPDRRGLLYAGTEFGVYVSFDDGKNWQSLQLKLPVTPVTDMAVKEKDLVISTQGRSFWILDDLTPLHQLDEQVAKASMHLFAPRETYRLQGGGGGSSTAGKNPPNGAMIFYNFAEEPEEEVVIEILDAGGEVIRSLSSKKEERRAPNPYAAFMQDQERDGKLPAKKGMNRYVWNLRYPDARIVEKAVLWGSPRGPRVVPGTYQVRLTVGEKSQTRSLVVKKDPRLETTQSDFEDQFDMAMGIYDTINEVHRSIETMRGVREQVRDLTERLKAAGVADEGIEGAAGKIAEKLSGIENAMNQTKAESAQDPLNFPPMLDNQLLYVYGVVNGPDARPTRGARQRFEDLKTELAGPLDELRQVLEVDLVAFNRRVRDKQVPPVLVPSEAVP